MCVVSLQTDKAILEHIVYDFGDVDMMEALRPSIEEAQPVQTQELALDYIGEYVHNWTRIGVPLHNF